MIIQSSYARFSAAATSNLSGGRPNAAAETAKSAGAVSFAQAVQAALSPSVSTVAPATDAKLSEIKAKGPMDRTAEDMNYLSTHDTKLAAIFDKLNHGSQLTSSEIDYEQKTIGFVNSMAALSPAEKQMYDDMLASGNSEAAAGMTQIAFIRATLGHTAGGAAGSTYDPISTEITAQNVLKYFMHSIVDPSGKSDAQFQALAQYLENRPLRSASSVPETRN